MTKKINNSSWIFKIGEDTEKTAASGIRETTREIQGDIVYQSKDSGVETSTGTNGWVRKLKL